MLSFALLEYLYTHFLLIMKLEDEIHTSVILNVQNIKYQKPFPRALRYDKNLVHYVEE